EIDQAEIGIDRGRLPDIGAALLVGVGADRIGIVRRRPGVGADAAWLRHGPEMPQLLAGFCIQRSELAARAAVAAGDAGIDRAFVIKRRRGDGVALLPAADRGLPEELAGFGVERDQRAVELADEDLAFADGNAAIVPAAAHRIDVLRDAG